MEIKSVFANAPSFRTRANEMIPDLFPNASHPDGHYIRPHSLRVTTISALMREVVVGNSKLRQLAAQWNYRAHSAHGVWVIYSRNETQQQLHASKFAHREYAADDNPPPKEKVTIEIKTLAIPGLIPSPDPEPQGGFPENASQIS